jgi:hypothetical protein
MRIVQIARLTEPERVVHSLAEEWGGLGHNVTLVRQRTFTYRESLNRLGTELFASIVSVRGPNPIDMLMLETVRQRASQFDSVFRGTVSRDDVHGRSPRVGVGPLTRHKGDCSSRKSWPAIHSIYPGR